VAKRRTKVPAPTRQSVLREYNHRCAVCAADRPHLHHIDQNPDHNDPNNLIPLCPNCHLRDQHNPTSRVDPALLSLFRAHRDPTILRPQFKPLFNRLQFLNEIPDTASVDDLQTKAEELWRFVARLSMGEFYGQEIEKLTKKPSQLFVMRLDGPDPENEARRRRWDQEYREQLRAARSQVYALVVELLPYQDGWREKPTA
jgi:hypothetical protein